MDPVTRRLIDSAAQRLEGVGLDEQIERARAAAANRAPQVTEPTLRVEDATETVPLITVTRDELHDLVYAAASIYLHSRTTLTLERGRMHARRIAEEALFVLRSHPDYQHAGPDPRAAS